MEADRSRENEFLKSYRLEDYKRPSVAVDTALFTLLEEQNDNYRKVPEKKLALLLVRRAAPPFTDMWVLPGGFLREKETLEEAAARELFEETGIHKAVPKNFKVYSEPGRDPRGWILSNAYFALTHENKGKLYATNDAGEAVWAPVYLKGRKGELNEKRTVNRSVGEWAISLELIRQMKPKDDIFFGMLMKNKEVCQEVLRVILGDYYSNGKTRSSVRKRTGAGIAGRFLA